MNRLLPLVLLVVVFVSGCEMRSDPLVSSTIKTYEVISIQRPKHFMVTFREVGTKNVHLEYISKRCSAWDKLKMGSYWNLTEETYQGKDGPYTMLSGVRGEFCWKLENL